MTKFILTENQINVLKEYINQLQIPFEEFGDEYGKENYDYYLDYIEKISKPGTLPNFNSDYNTIYKTLTNSITFRNVEAYVNSVSINDFKKINSQKELVSFFEKYFFKIDDFLNQIQFTKNGLIYVERIVSIDFLVKGNTGGFIRNKEIYDTLLKKYKNIGTHWSYLKGGADDFSKNDDYNFSFNSFVFKGFVSPKDVDWSCSLFYNVQFPNEHELNINENAVIQINEIIWLEKNKKLPLHQPIIVKA